jgi:hypothetical protein
MNSLMKRVEAMEQAEGVAERHFLWVQYAADGGLVYEGIWYADPAALAVALGYEPDSVLVFGWRPGETAADELGA